jgi:hypothetical protein
MEDHGHPLGRHPGQVAALGESGVLGCQFLADAQHPGRIGDHLGGPGELDSAQGVIAVTVLDQGGQPGVTGQVAGLLAPGVGPEDRARTVHDEPHGHEMDGAVRGQGGHVEGARPGQERSDLGLVHRDAVALGNIRLPAIKRCLLK